jgi:hypothetical protein
MIIGMICFRHGETGENLMQLRSTEFLLALPVGFEPFDCDLCRLKPWV